MMLVKLRLARETGPGRCRHLECFVQGLGAGVATANTGPVQQVGHAMGMAVISAAGLAVQSIVPVHKGDNRVRSLSNCLKSSISISL